MRHLGDITYIHGYDITPVDIITGGSPCQDLSVAGRRAGLSGERSGLFMEQIRIIKEMRGATDGKYPRYMVWENVPGAFSSNKGEDFRVVLEETARICDEGVSIPRPEKWSYAGCIMGTGWSIAWRVTDNQFWGTPQRRRRISLVADFRGATAPEILFECEGMSGHTSESEGTWQGTPRTAAGGIGDAVSFQERAGKPGGGKGILIQDEHVGALSTLNIQSVCYGISPYASNCMKSSNPTSGIYEAETSRTLDMRGGNPNCNQGGIMVVENHPQDSRVKISEDGTVQTLTTRMGTGGNNTPTVMCIGNGQVDQLRMSDKVGALNCMHDQQMVTYGLDRASYNQGKNAKFNFSVEEEVIGSQVAKGPGAVNVSSIVRRLTPMECERLQGFPDGWTDIGEWVDSKGKKHRPADSPRYKALGNSIALPYWHWMAGRMVSKLVYEKPYVIYSPGLIKLGSLFDGIGGFPFVFSEYGVEPVWASEIEEFPIAVTKVRFGE